MINHLPVFLLLTPLLSAIIIAFLSLFIKTQYIQKSIAALGLSLPFYYLVILYQKLSHGAIEYHMGNWEKPYAITLFIDELSFSLLCISAIIIFLCFIYSLKYMQKTDVKFYFFFLMLTTGLFGLFLSGDFFNLYIFFDLTIITSYILITFGDKKSSIKASFIYIVMSSIATFFFLYGIGFLYSKIGLLNIQEISTHFSSLDTATQIVILTMFLGALAIKAAIVPFHSWLVIAHSTAPSPISAILSAIIVKAGIYILFRVLSLGFSIEYLSELIIIFGIITMLGGITGALLEWDIKRILAYSTISHIGLIIIGIGTFSLIGITGGLFHLINHAFFKALLFLCAGSMIYQTGTNDIREQKIGKTMPLTMVLFIIASLAISGITPFNGSISKSLIESSVNYIPILWIFLLVSTIITIAVFSKIFYFSFMKSFKNKNQIHEVCWIMQIPMILLAALCILIGLFPEILIHSLLLPSSQILAQSFSFNEITIWDPVKIFKDIGTIVLGVLFLIIIIHHSKQIDKLRDFLAKFNLNISVFIMILTLLITCTFLLFYNS
jgi:multicomponent Na+:H+ antiporter subunit D